MGVQKIPENYKNVIPFLNCNNVQAVIDFAINAFGAKLIDIAKDDKGTIMHAALQIRDSAIMLAEANEKFPARETMMYIYFENADEVFAAAVKAGGKVLSEPTDEFYGDRVCGVADTAGNQWWLATHFKDYSN